MLVSFPGDGVVLRGFLHRPAQDGRHPAVVWNHGSEPQPGNLEALSGFFTEAGYVFFAPHRRGHGRSPGPYELAVIRDRVLRETAGGDRPRQETIRSVIALYERHLADISAAIRWLQQLPYVDADRVAVSGVSHGAIQALLTAEADLGPRAYFAFAPGAIAWADNPELHDRLSRAVSRAAAPIFLLQARNDYDLGPSRILGGMLSRKGHPNATRVYPPYGRTAQAGHGAFACQGMNVWGDDVRAFLREVLPAP